MGQIHSENEVKIARPFVNEQIVATVGKILRSGQLVQGPYVREFEDLLSHFIGCKYVVSVNSGTAALHAAIQLVREISTRRRKARKIPEVITTPLSFTATANAVLHAGCIPAFADVDKETFNIDPKKIKERLRDETIALEPVDVYGLPADLEEISKIAKNNGFLVIEDAAEAIGASFEGKRIGNISDLTCFSTYATKNLHTCEGGFITTNEESYAQVLEMIRSQGQASRYNHTILGYNYRMTEIAAAIGIPQVEVLDELNAKRRRNALQIRKALAKFESIRFQKVEDPEVHAWYMLAAVLDEQLAGMSRDTFVSKVRQSGIGVDVSWPVPIHLQPYYKREFGYNEGDFPVAEQICKSIFQIPIQPFLTEEEVSRVIDSISSILESKREIE